MMSRETLSAWMDGELHGDEGRFVAKRLIHDDAMQDQLRRWSAIGDGLRQSSSGGEHGADVVAPGGFLDRVRVAIDQERAQIHVPESAARLTALTQHGGHRGRSVAWRRRLKGIFQKPTAIAASISLVAAAVLLLRIGAPIDENLLTSMTMQNVTFPAADSAGKPSSRSRANANMGRRVVRANRNDVRGNRLNARVAMARSGSAGAVAPQVAATASVPATRVASPATSSTFGTVRPNVAVSANDPFGLGNASASNRVLSGASGRAWPRSSMGSGSNRTMRASFGNSPSSSGANDPFAPSGNWPLQMSLSIPGGE